MKSPADNHFLQMFCHEGPVIPTYETEKLMVCSQKFLPSEHIVVLSLNSWPFVKSEHSRFTLKLLPVILETTNSQPHPPTEYQVGW